VSPRKFNDINTDFKQGVLGVNKKKRNNSEKRKKSKKSGIKKVKSFLNSLKKSFLKRRVINREG